MLGADETQKELKLESGWLCLDYANTATWHASERPVESLHNYSDLVLWAIRIGIIADQEGQDLFRAAAGNPSKANAIYEICIALREALYHIFSTIAADSQPSQTDLRILNTALAQALVHLRLSQSNGTYFWEWVRDENQLDTILWPVARSAAQLLTSRDLVRVGECADDRGCGWLFFDTSRNRSRRWCDMKDCGNRDKVRRYYRKKSVD